MGVYGLVLSRKDDCRQCRWLRGNDVDKVYRGKDLQQWELGMGGSAAADTTGQVQD